MRKFLKRCVALVLVPATQWYLRKERAFTYQGATVKIFPGVFHPGLFHSTKMLIEFVVKQPIQGRSLLELGCGTGLISIICARKGAIVTASEVSRVAITNAEANVKANQVPVEIIHSDVFDSLRQKTFDWIIINPPYYAKRPGNERELAWHCGENFEYFQKLFENLKHHITITTHIIMVLTAGCELPKIFNIASANGFQFELLEERNSLFDGKDFLYSIKSLSDRR